MKALAPAPSRATASVVIGWGLMTIPVSLYTSVEETRVPRQERSPAGNPVGRQSYDKVTGETVDSASVTKVAVLDDVEVELTDDEILAVTGNANGVANLEGTIDLSDVGTVYFPEKLYQVRAREEKKGGTSHSKAFALLLTALDRRRQAAVIKVALRGGVARYAALTPDGNLFMLAFTNAVRQARPMTTPDLPDAELNMAEHLLEAIGPVTDDLTDKSSQAVADYIASKAAGAEPKAMVTPTVAPVNDLMDSLVASIEASKRAKES